MRPGAPGGDKTDSLFHRKDMYWVADIEEVVESTMDKTNTFMRERGLIPLNEREMVRTFYRNTVNNPTGFKAGLPTMEAAAHANTDSGGMVERRRTQNEGDDAEELAQMTLYPDDVSGIIMKAQDFYLHFDEPNDPQNEGKAMLKDWLDLWISTRTRRWQLENPMSQNKVRLTIRNTVWYKLPQSRQQKQPTPDQLLATHR
jgi:hypothetical protein